MLPLNLLSVNGLKQLAVKLLPWLVLIVVTVLLYLFAQHKWNEALETKYNAGVKDGKQAVVDEYENKAAQLRNKLEIEKDSLNMMLKNVSLQRRAMLIVLVSLLSACNKHSIVSAPTSEVIPTLTPLARQPEKPSECLPTCSKNQSDAATSWQNTLMNRVKLD